MKINIPDVEQGLYQALCMRAVEEGVSISDWFNARVRQSLRQKKSIMPEAEKKWSKVVEFKK